MPAQRSNEHTGASSGQALGAEHSLPTWSSLLAPLFPCRVGTLQHFYPTLGKVPWGQRRTMWPSLIPKYKIGLGGRFCFSPFSRVKYDPLTPKGAQNPSHPDNHFQMDLETSLPSVLDSGGAAWLSLTSWCGFPPPPSQALQPPFPSPHLPASWLLRALGRQFKVAPKGPSSIPVSLEEM